MRSYIPQPKCLTPPPAVGNNAAPNFLLTQFVVYDIQCNDGNGVFRTTITGEICYMDILHVVDVTPMGQEMGWCDDDIPDFHIMESIYAYLFSLYLSRLDDDCQILPTNTLFLGGV